MESERAMTVWTLMGWIIGTSTAIAVGVLVIGVAVLVVRGMFAAIPSGK